MKNAFVTLFFILVSTTSASAQQAGQGFPTKEINELRTEVMLLKKELARTSEDLESKMSKDRELAVSELNNLREMIELGVKPIEKLSDKSIKLLERLTASNQLSIDSVSNMVWIMTIVLSLIVGVLTFFGLREAKDFKSWRKVAEAERQAMSIEMQSDYGILEARYFALVERKYSKALRSLDKALEVNPRSPLIWITRAYIQKRQEDYSGAELSAKRAIELDPEIGDYHFNLACYCSLQGKFDEALVHLEEAIRLDPINKVDAKGDPDFDRMRKDQQLQEDNTVMNLIGRDVIEPEDN